VASSFTGDPGNPLLGFWGAFQDAAQAGGRGAANLWDTLNSAAYDQAATTLALTSTTPPTELEIQSAAKALIGNVTIQDMNGIAKDLGSWMSARQNLQSQGLYDQILGQSIFTPSWSTTAGNPAVPDRYRIRVLRDITVRGFTTIQRQEWASYELEGPLTNVIQALAQADARFTSADYNVRASINNVISYEIEQV